jgi:hypothetical protein
MLIIPKGKTLGASVIDKECMSGIRIQWGKVQKNFLMKSVKVWLAVSQMAVNTHDDWEEFNVSVVW